MQGLGSVEGGACALSGSHPQQVSGNTRPMAASMAPASVDSLRLKQAGVTQRAPRCPVGSGCREGGCGQGGHEWATGRGEAWLALARLQINSSPAASQPCRRERK